MATVAYFKMAHSPIQSVNRFDQRVQIFESKYSESYTADRTILMSSVYVGWRISDARAFFPKFYGGGVTAAQGSLLERMLRSATLNAVGRHNLSDLREFGSTHPAQGSIRLKARSKTMCKMSWPRTATA